MPKPAGHPDVLVIGQHPSAYLGALAVKSSNAKLRVAHSTLPGEETPDRLVTVNPEFFGLHKSLKGLEKTLRLSPIHGLRFLSADAKTASEYRDKSILGYVTDYVSLRDALAAIAQAEGVELHNPRTLGLLSVDREALHFSLGNKAPMSPKALLLAATPVSEDLQKKLAIHEAWDPETLYRYSFVRLRTSGFLPGAESDKPLQCMALDLGSELSWGWLLVHGEEIQLAVSQPVSSAVPAGRMLADWAAILHRHGQLAKIPNITPASVQSLTLPLAGALAHEGVANRTLLIGPAGGFYSATAEDIYPNCWSAIYAADVLRKSLKETHLQDALNSYREVWRTTLGEYLRGPQQNLRFLLPLVYRNPVMTARLTESILQGKPVVR